MHFSGRKWGQRSRAALCWGLVCFVGGQLAFLIVLSNSCPELRNPEYGLRLRRLRARLAERPAASARILVMGSSRVAAGFRPDALQGCQRSSPDAPVVLFNFGFHGSGPVLQLLCLRRLLDDGIKPDSIVLEVWPPMWVMEREQLKRLRRVEPTGFDLLWLRWQDLQALQQYSAVSQSTYVKWLTLRLKPWSSFRFNLVSQYAQNLVTRGREDDPFWLGLDPWGWVKIDGYAGRLTELPAEVRERMRAYFQPLLSDLCVDDGCSRSYGQLLTLCRQHKIGVRLLFMPEPSDLRSWYSAASLARVNSFLVSLSKEYDAPIIDARTWAPDEDFVDCAHLSHSGAIAFSQRLEREALP